MYDPESPTGSPVTVVQSVNGDSESSTNEDSKGLDKEEDDEAEPNRVAATKAARRMTRPRIKGKTAANAIQQDHSDGRAPSRLKGITVDSVPTSVNDAPASGDCSDAVAKNCAVVHSSMQDSSEHLRDTKAGDSTTTTDVKAMADDDDTGQSVDSSMQDESSLASAADSQTSSSDAGTSMKTKQKQGRTGRATAQSPKVRRRRASEEMPSFEGPATRQRSVRLRSGDKRRGTSPAQSCPSKKARQKKPPAAAKKQGSRAAQAKASSSKKGSASESLETPDTEPEVDQDESMQDVSSVDMERDAADCHVDEPHGSDIVTEGSQTLASACESDLTKAGKGVVSESGVSSGEPPAPSSADISDAVHQLPSSTAAEGPELKELVMSAVPADACPPCESEQQQKEPTEERVPEIQSTVCRESNPTVEACEPEGGPSVVSQPEANSTTKSGGERDMHRHQEKEKSPTIGTDDTTAVLTSVAHLIVPRRVQLHRGHRGAEPGGKMRNPTLLPSHLLCLSSIARCCQQNLLNHLQLCSLNRHCMMRLLSSRRISTLCFHHPPPKAQSPSLKAPSPPPKAPSPQRKETATTLDSSRPEKVKSRWRRSSELETRDTPSVPSISSPVAGSSPPCEPRMPAIQEEMSPAGSKGSPRRKERSSPTLAPHSKDSREARGTSSREQSDSTASPRASRDNHRLESSSRDSKDSRDYRDKDSRDYKDGKESRDYRDSKESRDYRDSKDSRDYRDSKDSRDYRDSKESRDNKDRGSASSATNGSSSKSMGYEDIEENLYLFERRKTKSKKEVRRMICDCSLTKDEKDRGIMGCEEDCLNRLLMIECGSRCPNGENCSNRRFQKKSYIKVEKFMTEKKGWGLRTLETVSSGTFVMEYVGEVLTPEDFRKRVKQYARDNNQHYYFMALRADEIIDATQKGNVSRFINHSCDPNCETQKWTVNGELRIGFFTRRPLRAGEELTFDYQFQRYGKEAQRCHCESSNCRGYIGEDTKMTLKSGRSQLPKRTSSSTSSSTSSTSSSSTSASAKRIEERKRDTVEDLAMEEEIEKLSGGLKNREHTLLLARLMVRGEDIDTRQRLLNIIKNTTETACLRLFLDYHGLSLLWSWMADIPDNELALKAEILTVLRQLPIPNKTMVKDSKVTSEEADSDASESSGGQTPASAPGQRSQTGSVVCSPDSTNLVENGDSTSSDGPKDEHGTKMAKDLSELASTLLDSWSSLKEVFRIPRLEQQKRREDEREADRRERERNRQQKNRESSFSGRDSNSRRRSPPSSSSRDRRDRDYERSSDRRRYSASPERRDDRKPYHRSSDHRRSGSGSGNDTKPRKTLLPTPPRLTKEERRQLFALEVQQRDQEEALRRQFMVPPATAVPPGMVVPAPAPQGFMGGTTWNDANARWLSQSSGGCSYGSRAAAATARTGAPIPAPQPPAPQDYILQHNTMLSGAQPMVAPGMHSPAEGGPHVIMQAPGQVVPGQQPMIPGQQPIIPGQPIMPGQPMMPGQPPLVPGQQPMLHGQPPMVPGQQLMGPGQQAPMLMTVPPEEAVPQHQSMAPNIDYQALAAAISSVTNKPP
ncbi:hypothetical protein MTO96_014515 [Rhipicephalus appendiculatus]